MRKSEKQTHSITPLSQTGRMRQYRWLLFGRRVRLRGPQDRPSGRQRGGRAQTALPGECGPHRRQQSLAAWRGRTACGCEESRPDKDLGRWSRKKKGDCRTKGHGSQARVDTDKKPLRFTNLFTA